VEPESKWGTLSSDNNGEISTQIIPSLAGDYGQFYNLMAAAIKHNAPVPTSAKHGADIIKVLETARKSFAEKKIISL
jgi:translation initiation factor 2 alpha subunit (eIF-2alpha)